MLACTKVKRRRTNGAVLSQYSKRFSEAYGSFVLHCVWPRDTPAAIIQIENITCATRLSAVPIYIFSWKRICLLYLTPFMRFIFDKFLFINIHSDKDVLSPLRINILGRLKKFEAMQPDLIIAGKRKPRRTHKTAPKSSDVMNLIMISNFCDRLRMHAKIAWITRPGEATASNLTQEQIARTRPVLSTFY